MKRIIIKTVFRVLFLTPLLSSATLAQDFPDKPNPPRLVNDFAGMLSRQEAGELEQKLVAFDDSTSTQIAIVTINSLSGYAIGDYAQRLAEKWGIGQKGLNNGVLVLVKPKTSELSRGEVFIAPGYGLEGVIPDIVCAEIVDNEILPAFRAGQYYRGLDRATSVLMGLARGEFSADQYSKAKGHGKGAGMGSIVFIIVIVLVMLFMRGNGGSNNRNIGRKSLPLWMLLSMMNSGSRHGGSWGGFSGGGGGGFGGFGGGGFGGGGAGGSW